MAITATRPVAGLNWDDAYALVDAVAVRWADPEAAAGAQVNALLRFLHPLTAVVVRRDRHIINSVLSRLDPQLRVRVLSWLAAHTDASARPLWVALHMAQLNS